MWYAQKEREMKRYRPSNYNWRKKKKRQTLILSKRRGCMPKTFTIFVSTANERNVNEPVAERERETEQCQVGVRVIKSFSRSPSPSYSRLIWNGMQFLDLEIQFFWSHHFGSVRNTTKTMNWPIAKNVKSKLKRMYFIIRLQFLFSFYIYFSFADSFFLLYLVACIPNGAKRKISSDKKKKWQTAVAIDRNSRAMK